MPFNISAGGAVPAMYILPSTRSNKKYMVSYNGKLIHFGAKGYLDYTQHKDYNRRELYRLRHHNDHINDPSKPGFYSWWLLWGPYTSIHRNLNYATKYLNLTLDPL